MRWKTREKREKKRRDGEIQRGKYMVLLAEKKEERKRER